MSTDTDWIDEARKRAAAKRGAKQARFMAPGDTKPTDEEVILVKVGETVEGIVVVLDEITTQYGPSTLATIDDAERGNVQVLAGAKILADLFEDVSVGDFVSMEWLGKKSTKDGSSEYRNWETSHTPAPGSTPRHEPTRVAMADVPVPSAPAPVMGEEEDDLDDVL